MTSITALEASFFKYLYENLEVPYGIKIFEDKNLVDYDAYEEWVVIDTLTNALTIQPKQLWFLHCAVQKGQANGKEKLTRLLDKVLPLVEELTLIDIYDYDTAELIGEAEVSNTSLSPVLQHPGGGSFRSITVGLVYAR